VQGEALLLSVEEGIAVPRSALPSHLDEPSEWRGTDWDNPCQRWMLKFKHWFAFGPRATEWWARWRPVPKDLIAVNCRRIETINGLAYTSVIQYWSRFSVLIQWPFHVMIHWYWPWTKIPDEPDIPGDFIFLDMIFVRFGARFDNDQVYWFPSFFIGGDFN